MATIFLSQNNQMLMLHRQGGRVVNNVWVGSAGGHFEKDELNDARACVLRELREELALTPDDIRNLTLKYIVLRRAEDEIRQNYYFFAELKENVPQDIASNEGQCKWFDYSELSALEMPLTAKCSIHHYLRVGMNDDRIYVGAANRQEILFMELPVL